MKKWLAGFLVIMLLLSGGTAAMAHGNSGKKGDHGNKHKHGDKWKDDCDDVVKGLEHALKKVKNEKAKAAIKQNIEAHKLKCKGYEDDDDDDDHDDDDDDRPALTDNQRVTNDKTALQIRYRNGDSASRVTGPIVLDTKGKYGSSIQWSSNKPEVISNNGQNVKRPSGTDETVVMTATIRYKKAQAVKSFTLRVAANASTLTDAQRVEQDKAALQIAFNGSDSASSVTQPLKELPVKGKNGSTITWHSGAPNIISTDGKTVNRPAAGTGDALVALTAVIQYQTAADVKMFQLTVKPYMNDADRVAADKAALAIDYGGSDNASSVTRPFDSLPAKGVNGSAIVWTSSDPAVISHDGKTVRRPVNGAGDIGVVLTAAIHAGSITDYKIFVVTVKQEFTTAEKIAADKAELAIVFADKDSAVSVTKPIGLPPKGYYGSTIAWYSSNPSIMSNTGSVLNRPAKGQGDATVTMTAVISNNGMTDLKSFVIKIKQMS
ncbi:immunoglobulin-like domain-containing protein [Paenibacillus spongiae]|uniref:Atrophied bacterial Ig domain-containing protein n=1 Tax=Paenibacillus spongiae TaxID=2909671 RepID=A0ABY5SGW3_9BACL|nr:immunoglobulin-like domain-containing protein [Paenibacillus spongiae]UVI32705.1 hypothetical protein L1F29_13140 [Paenibacillus spongiae]